ncbi:MAG: protoporphyrinogen oxidase [Dysgonamonadaceae bacterium]|jgi:oxygen-dependent protoporphyrinogen oxidase|nr:protoporphyrinogen oxidase [Dysgonamonadaceae bacterium]
MNKPTVIIGAGLTGLTTAFHLVKQGKNVLVLEKNDLIGGQIQTIEKDGFIFETGPNTGTVSNPEVAELFYAMTPGCKMEIANSDAARRLIWKDNKFHALPSGLLGGITTHLFTWHDKFRILGEPFHQKGSNPDETVGALAARRLGKSFLDYAVNPFISGIYAGNPMTLVTRYALPKLYNLEQNYGSFIRGAFAKAREPKSDRDKLATKKIFSVEGGLSHLIEALADTIGKEKIVLSADAIKINHHENEWNIDYNTKEGQQSLTAERIITTVGAHALSALLPFVEKSEIDKIACLRYAPIVQVSVGVKNIGGRDFNAFGGLIPACERKDILGILYPAACFRGRAPEGGMLFSFFIGGINKSYLTELSDIEIENIVVREFHKMLGFPANIEPDLIHIARHSYAIPQYEKDTGERLAAVERLQKRYCRLVIAGNLRDGISMADRIKQGASLVI